MTTLDMERILPLREELARHPLYQSLHTLEDLRVFMTHHIFSVWDFMSLVKYLQQKITVTEVPWMPRGEPRLRHFINRLVLEEEADTAPGAGDNPIYGSHFELYCDAMDEIGADAHRPWKFLDLVREQGLDAALHSDLVPLPARHFTETTFGLIREDKPHLVAAVLALGRERITPEIFRQILGKMRISALQAPTFHYYLQRHIELDDDYHGPLSMHLLETLCGDDRDKIAEAETAAEESLCARIRFWDGIRNAIDAGRAG
ncbi:MAG: DUF3050 domain-containing protein [Candidatus Thiosymbion ectosymbiont of Robbea hypermnestra]|nr:DUF3050 domain-containing protein [Candidatus Thiosymbion ectosymbiont of Robbea hypermnestra]